VGKGAVVVTGASTGIGEACALRLDRLGYEVFATVRRPEDEQALRARTSDRLVTMLMDITDEAAVDAAFKSIGEVVGARGLVGLVNNAGVAMGGPLEYLPLEHWRTQLEVNVIGQVCVARAALPLLRSARGRLVFIGSLSGRVSTTLMGPYGASKFAIEAIAESLRHELRSAGVRVALIEPGAVKTAIWEKGRALADELERTLPAEALERYRSEIAAVRQGIEQQDKTGVDPDRVAEVVQRALESSRPKARYLVGPDAKVAALVARWLPDGLRDRVIARFAGP